MLVEAALFLGGLATLWPSLTYMFVAAAAVLSLFYWRRGIDRRAAIVCLAPYAPTFVLV